MQLTRYTDYGLRLMIYLALQPRDNLSNIESICNAYDLSRNHLHKIVHQLGRAGVLHTVRGKHGGIRLACHPEQVRIGHMVRLLEGSLNNVVNCYQPRCTIVSNCRLQGVLSSATQAFFDVLDQYSLADLLQEPDALRHLLQVSPNEHALAQDLSSKTPL